MKLVFKKSWCFLY